MMFVIALGFRYFKHIYFKEKHTIWGNIFCYLSSQIV